MTNDPIIEEIHKIREEYAVSFNYDLSAIVKDLQAKEKQLADKAVDREPNLIVDEEAA